MPRKTFTYEGKRYSVQAKDDIEIGKKIAAKIKQIDSGEIVINKNTTVKKWTEEWLTTYQKDVVGEATYDYVKNIVDNHIVKEIGNMKIKDVKEIHLQKILKNQKGKSKSFITKMRQTMKNIFSKAYNMKLTIDNPAKDLVLPKAEDGTHRALTLKETKYVLELAENHAAGLWIMVMYYCGLRPQETATLQWKNIDFKNRVIKIETAREAKTNEIKEPKSKAGKRKVPIPKILYNSLVSAKGNQFDFVFTQPTTGKMHTKSSMRCLWSSFKRDLNIAMGTKVYRNQLIKPYAVADDLVPYCFRHSYCTNLQAAGVPINVARELMGHEDIETTQKYYTHESEDAFNNAVRLINRFYEPKKTIKKLKDSARKIKIVMIS